jgi:hypothetical protein
MSAPEEEIDDEMEMRDIPLPGTLTRELFLQWRNARRGATNPERMTNPVWKWLVKSYESELTDEELPDDIENAEKYIAIPHKSDLDLGSRLAFRFANEFLPDAADAVHDIFRRKGAYGRFKDLLDSRDMLQQWYEYEEQSTNEALRNWCETNGIDIQD